MAKRAKMSLSDLAKTVAGMFDAGRAALSKKTFRTTDNTDLDRTKHLTASEATKCLRSLAFAKSDDWFTDDELSGTGPVVDWSGVAQRGDAVESYVIDALFAAELPVYLAGRECQLSLTADHTAATLDGVVNVDDVLYPIEIKSVDPRRALYDAPRADHEMQCRFGYNLLLANRRRLVNQEVMPDLPVGLASLLIYVNANDFNERRVFAIEHTEKTVAETRATITQKAAALFAEDGVADPASLPPEGVANHGCTFCQYKTACNEIGGAKAASRDVAKKLFSRPNAKSDDVSKALRSYVAKKAEMKRIEAELDALSKTIKDHVLATGEETIVRGNITATLTSVAGRRTLDARAVEAIIGKTAMEDCYKIGAPSMRLTVETNTEN